MAIWQYRLELVPRQALFAAYGVQPITVPEEMCDGPSWWRGIAHPLGLEEMISSILPQAVSWSDEMKMWGDKKTNDATIGYSDSGKTAIDFVEFRIDAYRVLFPYVTKLCNLAKFFDCVFVNSKRRVLEPDDSKVVSDIYHSKAYKFVQDPISTLQSLAADSGKVFDFEKGD